MGAQSKPTTYYLVRHGEAENNVQGILNATSRVVYHLTSLGQAQAEAAARLLQTYPIDCIVASPLARARETAAFVESLLRVPLSIDTRLTEAKFGAFEGKAVASFLEFMEKQGGRTAGEPDQGVEGYMDIRERVRSFLADAESVFAGQHIVLVSHLDTLQELRAAIQGKPVGAEQGEHGWYPLHGSVCRVSAGTHPTVLDPAA